MASAAQPHGQSLPNDDRLAATYAPGTPEHSLLYGSLSRPRDRASRGNAHQAPQPRKRWQTTIQTVIKDFLQGPHFKYSKVKKGEIRILCLHPGSSDKPLRASMFNRKLEDVFDGYEALSYCWGGPNERNTHEILLRDLNATLPEFSKEMPPSGREKWRMTVKAAFGTSFPIRKGLHQALVKLRSNVQDVNIWVDAICIDQTDRGKEEKEEQLSRMADIYNFASNVCIWLGDSYESAGRAMELVRDITNFKTFDALIASPDAKDRWIALIELMKAPWFSRRWIIQEVALSRNATIHCSKHVVHWDDFADAVSLLTEKIDTLTSNFREEIFDDLETTSACILVQILTNVCRKSDDGKVIANLLDLETLVSTLLGFQATFPRDTIYSILSLARDSPQPKENWETLHASQLTRNFHNSERERANRKRRGSNAPLIERAPKRAVGLTPNYKFSTRDLFVAFVTRCIDTSEGLDIICRHWAPRVYDRAYGEEVVMPSWVSSMAKAPYGIPGASLGRQNGENFVAYSPRDQRRRYNASGSYKAEFHMVDDPSLDPSDTRRARTSITGSTLTWSPLPSPTLEKQSSTLVNSIVEISHPKFHLSNGTTQTDVDVQDGLVHLPMSFQDEASRRLSSQQQIAALVAIPHATAGAQQPPLSPRSRGLDERPSGNTATDSRTSSERLIPQRIPNEPPPNLSPSNDPLPDSNPIRLSREHITTGEAPSIQVDTLNVPLRSPLPSPLSTHQDSSLTPRGSGLPRSLPVRKATKTVKPEDVERQHELSGIMSVKGFILGMISEHSNVIRGGVIPGEWVEKVGWDIEQSNNTVPDTLWRLLVADRGPKGSKPPQWYKRACLHGLVDSRVADADGNLHTVMPADRKISEYTTRYFERVRNVVWNRRLIQVAAEPTRGIRTPLFGLAPKNCGAGDLVCVLLGCSVPVVLKQVKEYTVPVYQLIGEAYIHGMMDGEAVQDASLVERLKTDFIIT